MAAYEHVRAQPEVRAARGFAAVEQKAQQKRVTIVETWQQEIVQPKSVPAVREVEDDWFILLDVAAKKSGRVWLTQFNSAPSLHCTRSVLSPPPKNNTLLCILSSSSASVPDRGESSDCGGQNKDRSF